jgi:type I restriction enzyme R subunit
MPQLTPEYIYVEKPAIDQLKSMGWQHIEGSWDNPQVTERENFKQVLLSERLKAAIKRINRDDDGNPWLEGSQVNAAASQLERLGALKLMEANQMATELLLKGTVVEGNLELHGDRDQTVRFIDFEHPQRNDFLAINQFRVDSPWAVGDKDFIIPDLVLFVNGIPLVVIECKSPSATNPMEEGITQLLRYSNQRDWIESAEGAERLFHYNQFLVSTHFYKARVGTIGASFEHYLEWKDTSPVPTAQVATQLGVQQLCSQQTLVAGMLRPEHLLDIVRNFTLFSQSSGKTIKIVARYQQFRAVQEAIRRLRHGQTRIQNGESDRRGGIIWHTQGSGKSLTMVFLVKKLRTLPELRRFKVVVVTDRTDLEKQLKDTASLTGETVRPTKDEQKTAESATERLQRILQEQGPDLVFAMIQKYQQREDEETQAVVETELFPVLNESDAILVLVDEAHRSQANQLHANLMRALPNCAKIGFTGTPIIIGDRKRTHEIFGEFIDRYTIQQSEADGATVPILYEGRTAEGAVADGQSLDQLFEDMFRERTPEELEKIKAKYATKGNVLEAPKLIAAKAADMLHHYIDAVLPNGFKAQVVASSRLAAVRYQQALVEAHQKLLAQLDALDPLLLSLDAVQLEQLDPKTQFLVRAYPHIDTLRRLEFVAVISSSHNDDPAWKEWSDKAKQDNRIERFKKPLVASDLTKQDGLAFLCVKSMLLTGFDAPVEQVLYLDRSMQGHELLQAIARVNRSYQAKKCGLVVDYYGVGRHLNEALAVYSDADIQGALVSLKDELPKLADRHKRVLSVFSDRGIPDINDVDSCVDLLRDIKIRAEFVVKLKQFMESLDIVLPRPEALPYVRDAKVLGFINKSAANLYRDSQLNLIGAGNKVRQLIDHHIESKGIDPKVPPISILDANFEQAVDARTSNRAKASEMEHAARYHINKNYQQDPAYYKKLSKRLEEILESFQNQWEELVAALRQFTQEVRSGRPSDDTGLDPSSLPH